MKLRRFLADFYHRIRAFLWFYVLPFQNWGRIGEILEEVRIFDHKSFLYRELKGVDMWMQKNKVQNLNLAINRINGFVLKPGEKFSFWREVGRPTSKKGYLEGMVLHNGEFFPGVGGGLCQLTNLLYWMTLHTELDVVERWRHSYDVFPDARRKLPFGSGATCSFPYIDLKIENNTERVYRLELFLTDQYLNGVWYADSEEFFNFKIREEGHRFFMNQFGWWRENEIYRDKLKNGELVDSELIVSNCAKMMYEPALESSSGDDSIVSR